MSMIEVGRAVPKMPAGALTLTSSTWEVVVLPFAGGRIYSLRHHGLGRELLWQNPLVPAAKIHGPASYDDNWCGGWDDVFPNDEPAIVNGLPLPDHGELWSADFDITHASPRGVRLRTNCPVSGFEVEKNIHVGEKAVSATYRIANMRSDAMPFMWKLHPAVRVAEGDRICIPAQHYRLEPASLGTLEGAELSGRWPCVHKAGRCLDLRSVLGPQAGELRFAYALDLTDGHCGVYRPQERSLCLWTFPKHIFSSCMLFASYGGWRGHQVAVLEPTSAWPFRLEEAITNGTCAVLGGGQKLEVEIRLEVLLNVSPPC